MANDATSRDRPPEINRWIVAVSVMFGTFMVVLDTTVVNVSLPHIAGGLSSTVEQATWALTSYLAANAVILPITGWLANVFGRKRLLLISVTGFTTASFLCGLSPSLAVLIFFRVVQGATGGVMQPLSQAVLLEAFPPEERGKAMGFWGVGIVVAPILGPVLGGWLTDQYSWRWVFYINIPVGVVAFVMTALFIYDPPYIRRAVRRIDYMGLSLLAIGVGALQVALDRGQNEDWFSSRFITLLLVASAVALVALVVRELTIRHPVIELRVFKERTFSTGVILITALGFGLYGSLVLLPILLESLMGYPPLAAGIAMAPRGIGSLIAMPLVGLSLSKLDPRKVLAAGFLTGAWTLYWLSNLTLDAGYWDLFWPQFVQGVSLGLLFVPLTTVTMDPIPNEHMGNATSLFNLMRNIGGSVGIAATQTVLARHRQIHTSLLGEHVTRFDETTRTMLESIRRGFESLGSDPYTAARQALAAIRGMVERQAAMLSFVDAFRLLAVIFLALTPLVIVMRRPRSRSSGPVAME